MGQSYKTIFKFVGWTFAGATGDPEKISEQIMIKRLLDAVSPELRAWLKERKPVNAEELGNMANLHVQSRKGPLVDGRYAPFGSQGFKQKRSSSRSSTERDSEVIHTIQDPPLPIQ